MPTKHAKFLVISSKLSGSYIYAREMWDEEKQRLVGYSWSKRERATEFSRREDADAAASDELLSQDGAEVHEVVGEVSSPSSNPQI